MSKISNRLQHYYCTLIALLFSTALLAQGGFQVELIEDVNQYEGFSHTSYGTGQTLGGTLYWLRLENDSLRIRQQVGSKTVPVAAHPAGSFGAKVVEAAGKLYFAMSEFGGSKGLYSFDGSSIAFEVTIDGFFGGLPVVETAFNGSVFITGQANGSGLEPHKYDGTTLSLVSDINAGSGSSSPQQYAVSNGALWFQADGPSGKELYRYDTAGNVTLFDIRTGGGDSSPQDIVEFDNKTWFAATITGFSGRQLHYISGDTITMPASVSSGSSGTRGLHAINNDLYLTLMRNNTREVARYNTNDTVIAVNIDGLSWHTPVFFEVNNQLFIYDEQYKQVSAIKNDTVRLLYDDELSNLDLFVNNNLYTVLNDGLLGDELYSFDGTAFNLIVDSTQSTGNLMPYYMSHCNGSIYFRGTVRVVDSTTFPASQHDEQLLFRYDGNAITNLGIPVQYMYRAGDYLLYQGPSSSASIAYNTVTQVSDTFTGLTILHSLNNDYRKYAWSADSSVFYFLNGSRVMTFNSQGELDTLAETTGTSVSTMDRIMLLGDVIYISARTTSNDRQLFKLNGSSFVQVSSFTTNVNQLYAHQVVDNKLYIQRQSLTGDPALYVVDSTGISTVPKSPNHYFLGYYNNQMYVTGHTIPSIIGIDNNGVVDTLINAASNDFLPFFDRVGVAHFNNKFYFGNSNGWMVVDSTGIIPADSNAYTTFNSYGRSNPVQYNGGLVLSAYTDETGWELAFFGPSGSTGSANLVAMATVNNHASCNGAADGAATASAAGGVSPFTYAWSNGESTSAIAMLSAGSYTVTVTDASAQTAVASMSITEPNAIDANVAIAKDDCLAGPTGSFTANPTGGSSPYTYAWSTGASTAVLDSIESGQFALTVSDANGCNIQEALEMVVQCEQAGNLRHMLLQDTSVRLSWDTICGATTYKITYKVFGTSNWMIETKEGNVGAYVLENLTPDTRYRWGVRAFCGPNDNFGSAAVLQDFTTLSEPCKIPTNRTAAPVQTTQARLNWSRQPIVRKYRIQWREMGGSWTTVVKDSVWDKHWLTGLTPGTTYQWRMKSVCEPGVSSGTAWSAIETFSTPTSKMSDEAITGEDAVSIVRVFPNPNNGRFQIDMGGLNGNYTITLRDVAGRIILREQSMGAQRTILQVTGTAHGMYVLTVEGKDLHFVQPIIIDAQ